MFATGAHVTPVIVRAIPIVMLVMFVQIIIAQVVLKVVNALLHMVSHIFVLKVIVYVGITQQHVQVMVIAK